MVGDRHRVIGSWRTSLAVPLLLAAATLIPAVPAGAQDVDPAVLRERCEANAPNKKERATCLEVVEKYLTTPVTPTTPPTTLPPATGEAIEISGSGEVNTDPFELAAGDHLVTIDTSQEAGSMFGCITGADLTDPAADTSVGQVQAASGPTGTTHHETYLFGVPAGRYYWKVQFGCPDWTFSIAPVTIPVTPPSTGTVTSPGVGRQAIAPLELAGGDYAVDWTLTPNSGDCTLYASLIPEGEQYGERIESTATGGTPATGHTRLYGVEPGVYHWDAWTADYNWNEEPCSWELSITPA